MLDVGADGIDGLAAHLEVPIDIVERGLSQLLKRGTVVKGETQYVLPKFMDAQEARQSDAQRQRESRERRRAKALGFAGSGTGSGPNPQPPPNVTNRDANPGDPSRFVTETGLSVTPVQPVQPSLAGTGLSLFGAPTADGWTPPPGGRAETAISDALKRGVDVSGSIAKWKDWLPNAKDQPRDIDAHLASWLRKERSPHIGRSKKNAPKNERRESPSASKKKPSPGVFSQTGLSAIVLPEEFSAPSGRWWVSLSAFNPNDNSFRWAEFDGRKPIRLRSASLLTELKSEGTKIERAGSINGQGTVIIADEKP
ncbi:MAG: hypothetical protein ACKV2T_17190 [Kofleriaceae bacterium]